MRELIRHPGAVTRRAGSSVTLHGSPAQSTERLSFTGEPITWADLPRETRKAAARRSPVVAEAAERLPALQRAANGRTTELATAWRMYEDAVVLATVLRHLSPAAAGYWLPGPWKHLGVRVLPLTGPLRRRSGLVAVAVHRGPTSEGGSISGSCVSNPEHAGAARAWDYLPEAVRSTAERLVPEPSVWLGEIVQSTAPGGWPLGQSVQVLRMDTARAVAIVADRALPPGTDGDVDARRRQLARTPWLVEQVGADLGADHLPLTLPHQPS